MVSEKTSWKSAELVFQAPIPGSLRNSYRILDCSTVETNSSLTGLKTSKIKEKKKTNNHKRRGVKAVFNIGNPL